MPYVSGWLVEGPVDPGYAGGRPGGGAGGPVDPGYGISSDRPALPIVLPPPPPGIWPPPTGGNPIGPIIDNTLPVPPGCIWPTPNPPTINNTLPGGRPPHVGGERPDNTLPGGAPPLVDNTLPSQTFWMLCYCPSLGWKYVSVDPSLKPGLPLPGDQPVVTPQRGRAGP